MSPPVWKSMDEGLETEAGAKLTLYFGIIITSGAASFR